MKPPVSKMCAMPGCMRTRDAQVHKVGEYCHRCKDWVFPTITPSPPSMHPKWKGWVSVAYPKSYVEHHGYIDPAPVYASTVTAATIKSWLTPEMEGVSFD